MSGLASGVARCGVARNAAHRRYGHVAAIRVRLLGGVGAAAEAGGDRPREGAIMRRILATVAVLSAFGAMSSTSWAAGPPEHDFSVTKDNTVTIPPLAECPANGAASVDLVFHEQFHATFTDGTFHVTDTLTGSFTSRDAAGNAIATGHFVSRSSQQGPGDPVLAITEVIKANGVTTDGSRVNIRLLSHLTVTPDGEPVRDFAQVSCG